MGGEWESRRLADVATVVMGQSPPGATYNEEGRGLPFFQGVKDFSNRYPRKRVYCTAPTRFAEPGDILFSVRAPIGEINRAAERCCIGRGLAAIRGQSKYDTDYLEYVLRSIRDEWHILEGQGAVFGNAKKSDLENLIVPWPEEEERRAIAHILGTLDDKIELNRRMNETLEAMAQALFKSWFVDFDPVVVNALRTGNPIPDKFAERAAHYRDNPDALGLPERILRIFPDRFVDSELGPIPEGWEVARLGDMVVTVKGRSYKSSELMPSKRALVTLKSFKRGGGYRPDGLKPYIGKFKPEQEVRPGEVVIACTDVTQAAEVIGRPALVQPSPHFQTLIASLDTMIVRPRAEVLTRAFLFFLLSTQAFIEHTYAHTTGTTVLHLSKNAVPSFAFAYPGVELITVFDSLAKSILEYIVASEQEIHTLIDIRNTLLPKLISGELRVPAAAFEELSAQAGVPDVERYIEGRGI